MTEEKLKNLSPYYRDFCEVWKSEKKDLRKVMLGTCLACVYGDRHGHSCEREGAKSQ